jgi:hypothetical protein
MWRRRRISLKPIFQRLRVPDCEGFLLAEAAQNTVRSLTEWHSKYLHRWVTSEDFVRQRLQPVASGCASNPIPQRARRQAGR